MTGAEIAAVESKAEATVANKLKELDFIIRCDPV
jgi:hypothetical protein